MNCQTIIKKIADSILNNWECEQLENSENFSIVTDIILPNNDCIEIMVEPKSNNQYIIHDIGLIFNYLFLYGINLADRTNTKKLTKLNKILENYKANFVNNRIVKETDFNNLACDINLLIQAIRESAIFHYILRPVSIANFKEKIYTFFASRQTCVNMDYAISGRIKNDHNIDIRLNGNKEFLSKSISTKSSSQLQNLLERAWFAFEDIQKNGRNFSSAIFYDDTTKDRLTALKEIHFEQIQRSEVPIYLFDRDKKMMEQIASEHKVTTI